MATAMKKSVSFNNTVRVVSIPGRSDVDRSTPRTLCLAELMRNAISHMNMIDKKLEAGEESLFEEEDVLQRMVIYRDSSPIAKAIPNSPPLKHLMFNTPIRGVTYDDFCVRDKVALDFINCIIDGVSSRDPTDEDVSPRNTLHILLDPSPDDFVDDMEHCLILNTTSTREYCGGPAFRALFDVYLDA